MTNKTKLGILYIREVVYLFLFSNNIKLMLLDIKIPDVVYSYDRYVLSLNIMYVVCLLLLFFSVVGLVIFYREPNPHNVNSVVHIGWKDRRLWGNENLKVNNRLPVETSTCESLLLLYGVVYDKNFILVDMIVREVQLKGYVLTIEGDRELLKRQSLIYNDKVREKLHSLIGEKCYLDELYIKLQKTPIEVTELINLYIDDSLSSIENDFLFKLNIHGTKVYYPGEKIRDILRDIKRLTLYIESYGIESLEQVIIPERLWEYGRLLCYLGYTGLRGSATKLVSDIHTKITEALNLD